MIKIEAIFLNTSTIESGIPDAPIDGNKYGRKNGTWEAIDVDKNYVDNKLSTKADLIHKHEKSDITDFPTNVSSFTNDAGYITSETDPTVPSWAKESSKPTYNASEVGAIATGGLKTINGESLKVIRAALDNKQDAGNYATKDELNTKANASDVYTKSETYSTEEMNQKYQPIGNYITYIVIS